VDARDRRDGGRALIVVVGRLRCALPLAVVTEVMRTQPVERLDGAPRFVHGVAVIRGGPVPVVDLGALLDGGAADRPRARLVTLLLAGRPVALAVDAIDGLRWLDEATVLPPLLGALDPERIAALQVAGPELLVVLGAARLVPDEAWPADREVGA
jgi:purine-binding chemotaxis protein CheW